jgi:hypothetical protein
VVHIPFVDEDGEQKESPEVKDGHGDLQSIFAPSMVSWNLLLSLPELVRDDWFDCIVSGFQGDFLSLISTHLTNINHYTHSALERQLIPIMKQSELTDDMRLTHYAPSMTRVQETLSTLCPNQRAALTELLIAVKHVNYLADKLRRLVAYEVRFKKVLNQASASASSSVHPLRQYHGLEEGIRLGGEMYLVQIYCEVLDGSKKSSKGDSWIWSTMIFLQRYFQIQRMCSEYQDLYEENLELIDEVYLPESDPFYDSSVPELIGVSTLHIDSLYHLIDTRDTLPIITFKGNHGGQLKLHARIWIDKVETVPSYISVDKESKLIDFMGRMAIIRFYFEYLFSIPPALSNDLQIIFSFFGSSTSGQYRTPRSPAMNLITGDKNCYVNSAIVIEQKITPDFVRFIQKKSIEFEIWGTRLSNRQYDGTVRGSRKMLRVGEPIRLKTKVRELVVRTDLCSLFE